MNLFYCYSYKMKKFFESKGFPYVEKGSNKNNNKPYWCYLRGEILETLISEYNKTI